MLLRELKCPGCGAPLKSKERDHMLMCSHCGRLSLYAKGTVSPVDFRIAAAEIENTKAELVYIPFWIVHGVLDVRSEKISGGKISRFVKNKKQMRGERDFYVCAASAVPEEISRVWNMDLTLNQPEITGISGFKGGKREVMTMEQGIAGENAEFLFLRYETEIPGTLQGLDYSFTVASTQVLYLPAFKTGTNNYMLGIHDGND